MPEVNEFATDTHRRVAANLGQPRSARDLAKFLHANDPYVSPNAYRGEADDADGVVGILKDLEADGLVKRVGSGTSKEIVDAIAADDDLPTLAKAKAGAWRDRADLRRDSFPYPEDEDQWVHTQKFLAKIDAPTPNEPPPLEGAALKDMEARNAEIAAADKKLAEGAS